MAAWPCVRSSRIGWTCSVAEGARSRHQRHDGLLIAAALDDGAVTRPSLANTLLATCLDCARLHADLLSLALALPAASTPARPRDFTLTQADAERLRPRGLRRWLGLIGTSRDTITRPLAIGFTTLGLAGLLVATVPGALPGSGAPSAEVAAGNAGAPRREIQSAASPSGAADHILSTPDSPAADEAVPPAFVALSGSFLLTGGALLVVRRARSRGPLR